jgi:hypothetical protein
MTCSRESGPHAVADENHVALGTDDATERVNYLAQSLAVDGDSGGVAESEEVGQQARLTP